MVETAHLRVRAKTESVAVAVGQIDLSGPPCLIHDLDFRFIQTSMDQFRSKRIDVCDLDVCYRVGRTVTGKRG